jgi:formate hydrogenlyase transcriptional activator
VERLKERLEAENVYLREEVSAAHRHREIIGESEGIRKVLQQVEQVAGTDMTVLILGETGTGKELVARAVHERSERRERSLVKVNCSALPGELIESELFGHEKGAFTGATGRQVGRFELADGGTIFLDEVGDLPLKLQAKLLRVLQEGEFERLGSGKTIKVDVRVIAATNRNLAEAMQRGMFRLDLYYRLNVYPIQIPALRERREDIGLLAETFLGEVSRRLGRVFDPVPGEVLEVLRRYEWPGNVRELQNVIERAAVVSSGRRLQLTEEWAAAFAMPPVTAATEVSRSIELVRREPTLEELERSHIVEVLHQTGWRVEGPKGAAIILGLNPSTLRSRMLKFGIRRTERPVRVPAS